MPQASCQNQPALAKTPVCGDLADRKGNKAMKLNKVAKAIFAGLALLVLFASTCFAAFTEGVDYVVLDRKSVV